MKKIPTLFVREYDGHGNGTITETVTPGFEWILQEGRNKNGTATIKWDGSCTAVLKGEFYRRYDAKKGKKAPEGAIPCQEEADPITGHFPHWLKCDRNKPEDKWYMKAYDNYLIKTGRDWIPDGTYEAIGPHFSANPYHLEDDILVPHGMHPVQVGRSFEEIREYLKEDKIEGLVFWKDGVPQCKIKRKDFGFPCDEGYEDRR